MVSTISDNPKRRGEQRHGLVVITTSYNLGTGRNAVDTTISNNPYGMGEQCRRLLVSTSSTNPYGTGGASQWASDW